MPRQEDGTIVMEGARLIWKNFSGRAGRYNAEGERGFSLDLRSEPELADLLIRDGWNVKQKPPREEGDTPLIHLPVTVMYGKGRPPTIILVTSKGRRKLGENEVMLIDYADIENIDLIVRPYNWDVQGRQGKKAYLKEIFVTIHESVLDLKYADVPDISLGPDPED